MSSARIEQIGEPGQNPASTTAPGYTESELTHLVLNTLTSAHSRRAYKIGLEAFFSWVGESVVRPDFSKALLNEYKKTLIDRNLSPSTINLRLSPVRKLAAEMADNDLLNFHVAGAIGRVKGEKSSGIRVGKWLMKEQANALLSSPDAKTLIGIRDRAILGLLLGCGLRRAELIRLKVERLQQREGRWVLPDMAGKGNKMRTVTVPPGVKARIDDWLAASGVVTGYLFRRINQTGKVLDSEIKDEKTVWRIVRRYAKKSELPELAPHDLRRTCAKLCLKAGGNLEQIRLLLGHGSIVTTQRYLGSDQDLVQAVNDAIGLDMR